jgi:DNA-directed RNA polymerase subunit RPC12/RpoP
MPKLSDEKIRAIEILRAEGVPIKRTAIILGVSRDTVQKYEGEDADGWDQSLEVDAELVWSLLSSEMNPSNVVEEEEYIPDDVAEGESDRRSGPDPSETPLRSESEDRLAVADDYGSLSPGEFIEKFFESLEVGVKSKFIRLQARRAERRGEVPDEEKMRSDMDSMASGIKGREVEYVAEEYWAEAEKFVKESTTDVFRGKGDDSSTSGRGEMVSVGGDGEQQGKWYTMPDGSRAYGTFVPDGSGGQRFQPLEPPQQGGQPAQTGGQMAPQPQQGGGNREVAELKEELRELRREMGNGGSSLQEQIEEFSRVQDMMKKLQEGDQSQSDNQTVEVLRRELRGLRQELNDQAAGAAPEPGDPREQLFQRALQNEEMDSQEILDLADRLDSASDPEVEKKKIDRDLERRRMEAKQERTEKALDALQGVAATFGSALGDAIVGDDDDDGGQSPSENQGQTQQEPQPQQAPQSTQANIVSGGAGGFETDGSGTAAVAGTRSADDWECPQCGAVTEQDPATPGKACKQCDFSVVPCPDCKKPVSIPPADELERGGCPECSSPVMLPDEDDEVIPCLECDWVGPVDEAMGDTIECPHCGNETHVQEG